MGEERIIIPKTWRSECVGMLMFFVLSVVSIWLTDTFRWSIVQGELFTIAGMRFTLSLPLFWFIPALTIGNSLYRIYNVRYSIDSRGIEEKHGILAMRTKTTQVRYEDVRSVELEQTLLERILHIGEVEIGTAATGATEIKIQGVAAPEEVQDMIQRERDRRTKLQRERSPQAAQRATA